LMANPTSHSQGVGFLLKQACFTAYERRPGGPPNKR
jgi:hypothetical protein